MDLPSINDLRGKSFFEKKKSNWGISRSYDADFSRRFAEFRSRNVPNLIKESTSKFARGSFILSSDPSPGVCVYATSCSVCWHRFVSIVNQKQIGEAKGLKPTS